MKPRKIPMRKCVVSGDMVEKKRLLRVVKNKDGEVFFDRTGKANGRGAYVKNDEELILKAKKHHILDRILDTKVPDEVYDTLYEYAETHI
jgi:Predicted nucleic-acid-binding protein implicated in transcription termination